MSPSVHRINFPEVVNDCQSLVIGNKEYLIVSFGSYIRIFDEFLQQKQGLQMSFNVSKILVFQEYFYLIGRYKYICYKGFVKIKEYELSRELNNLKCICHINNYLIFMLDSSYSIGQIRNLEIIQSDIITDDAFFIPQSYTTLEDVIYILAKTFTKKYMISYTVENNKLKCNRRELNNGLYIFKSGKRLILLDDQGMWSYNFKNNSSIFIKKFGNIKIVCDFYVSENQTLLFCKNGEVLSIKNDLSYDILGVLDFPALNVSKINEFYFCSSVNKLYVLKIKNLMLEIIDEITSVNNSSILSHLDTNTVKFYAKNNLIELSHAIKPTACVQSSLDNYKQIESIYFNERLQVVSFGEYSIVNGFKFDPILSFHPLNDSLFFFTTYCGIYEYNLIDNKFKIYNIPNAHVKYYEYYAVIYYNSTIAILNLLDSSFLILSAYAEDNSKRRITTKNMVNLCDFTYFNNFIYWIDFNEILYKYSLDDFISSSHLEKQDIDLISSSENINIPEQLKASELDSDSRLLVANGKVFIITNDEINILLDCKSYIKHYILFKNFLVISANNNTIVLNLESSKVSKIEFTSNYSFVSKNILYLCNEKNLVSVAYFEPVFSLSSFKPQIESNVSIIYKNRLYTLYYSKSLDQKSIYYHINQHKIGFNYWTETSRCLIRNNLLCIGLVRAVTKETKIVFIKISKIKENYELKIRKEINSPLVLSISSYKNTVAIVTSYEVFFYDISYGDIKETFKIFNDNIFCKYSCFVKDYLLFISSNHLSFKLVNLNTKSIEEFRTMDRCIPVILFKDEEKIVGYARNEKLIFSDNIIELYENISNVVHKSNGIFLIGVNGSIFYISNDNCNCNEIIVDKFVIERINLSTHS